MPKLVKVAGRFVVRALNIGASETNSLFGDIIEPERLKNTSLSNGFGLRKKQVLLVASSYMNCLSS